MFSSVTATDPTGEEEDTVLGQPAQQVTQEASAEFQELDTSKNLSKDHPPPDTPKSVKGVDGSAIATDSSLTNNDNGDDDGSEAQTTLIQKYLPMVSKTHDTIHEYFFTSNSGSFSRSIRNPITFLAPSQFSAPDTFQTVLTRLNSNTRYFLANYLILALITAAMWVLTSPMALFGLLLIGFMWAAAMRMDKIDIAGIVQIGGKVKTTVALGMTVLLVVLFGILHAVTMGGAIAGGLSGIHAIFHKPVAQALPTTGSNSTNDTDSEGLAIEQDTTIPMDPVSQIQLGAQIGSYLEHV